MSHVVVDEERVAEQNLEHTVGAEDNSGRSAKYMRQIGEIAAINRITSDRVGGPSAERAPPDQRPAVEEGLTRESQVSWQP